jgi:4-amino-4-deoxy-L-arabinose transferase-like glycosyltransferase
MQFLHRDNHLKLVHWHRYLIGGVLMAWIGTILCLSSVPPVSRDALTHHLRVPQLYIDHGGMIELPAIEFSYYPMNLDLLYLLPMLWGNDIVPKYIHFAFALLTTALLLAYLNEKIGTGYAWFGAFFFLSLPIIVKLSTTVYVDLGLVFFFTAAIMQLFRWMEARYSVFHLIMAGVFCGLALGTKYNSLIGFVLLAGAIPFLMSGSACSKYTADNHEKGIIAFSPITAVLLFCGVALFVYSPWMIRNLLWTGNPLYPLFDSLFNPSSAVGGGGLSPFAVRHLVYKEHISQIIMVPLRIFFNGQDNNPQLFDGRLSPFLLLLPLSSLLTLRSDPPHLKREKWFLLYFSAFTILIVFFKQDMRIRYIVPAIPPLVILSAMGLHHLGEASTRWLGGHAHKSLWATAVVGCGVILFNLPYLVAQWRHVDPLSYLQGDLSRDAYVEKYRPEYALYRYANSQLGDEIKILGLFLGNRGYYSKREIVFDISGFKTTVESADVSAAIQESLRAQGVTHLMIDERLFIQWAQTNLSANAQIRLAAFLKNDTQSLLRTDKGFALLAVRPSAL